MILLIHTYTYDIAYIHCFLVSCENKQKQKTNPNKKKKYIYIYIYDNNNQYRIEIINQT